MEAVDTQGAGTMTGKPLFDANSDNPLEASIARLRGEEAAWERYQAWLEEGTAAAYPMIDEGALGRYAGPPAVVKRTSHDGMS